MGRVKVTGGSLFMGHKEPRRHRLSLPNTILYKDPLSGDGLGLGDQEYCPTSESCLFKENPSAQRLGKKQTHCSEQKRQRGQTTQQTNNPAPPPRQQ